MNKEDVMYTHNGIFFSHKKRIKFLPFVTIWMNPEGILSGKPDRKTNTIIFHLYMESEK